MVKRITNPLRDRDLPLGTLMSSAGARLGSRLDAALAEAGFTDLRSAHAAPFIGLDPGGTRPSVLAARAQMTKQAMGELIAYLVEHGYLETVADPTDGRARLVRATPKGWRALEKGVEVIDAFDIWLADRLGEAEAGRLRRALQLILEEEIP
ncbi:MarR family winged helix-turn-helix transcriptional regulator [Segeticoccus rhizosphaerae]|jgi:DNA-binding MarR family transcriptional regulator|uniref:MarR family winged helix-turn-helix transcriptional regulator n=1 Tax=Segeticoccus rhizosphaerae TaxID=1104777 RepID=UPI0010C0DA05|nr:MarR family transcriptional regulator [Ornithinicoccus soli]